MEGEYRKNKVGKDWSKTYSQNVNKGRGRRKESTTKLKETVEGY